MTLFLTIDAEDWFQVENLREVFPYSKWENCEVRIGGNVARILDLLDCFDTKATFFVLGWVAERWPNLVREIHKRGHEVASHGYAHRLVQQQKPEEFKEDILKSRKILQDIIGDKVLGYRAPSFSITDWAIEIIKEVGYEYDSSFMPASVSVNKRYGRLGRRVGERESVRREGVRSDGIGGNGVVSRISQPHALTTSRSPCLAPFRFPNGLWEFPVGVLEIGGRTLPWGGGAYFRLIPYPIFRAGLRRIQNNGDGYYVFYLHPWELDPDQPRVKGLRWDYRLRHYFGLNRTEEKLKRLLADFAFGPIRED